MPKDGTPSNKVILMQKLTYGVVLSFEDLRRTQHEQGILLQISDTYRKILVSDHTTNLMLLVGTTANQHPLETHGIYSRLRRRS